MARCLSLKKVLDKRSCSSYYCGNKVWPCEKALSPLDLAGAGL